MIYRVEDIDSCKDKYFTRKRDAEKFQREQARYYPLLSPEVERRETPSTKAGVMELLRAWGGTATRREDAARREAADLSVKFLEGTFSPEELARWEVLKAIVPFPPKIDGEHFSDLTRGEMGHIDLKGKGVRVLYIVSDLDSSNTK